MSAVFHMLMLMEKEWLDVKLPRELQQANLRDSETVNVSCVRTAFAWSL